MGPRAPGPLAGSPVEVLACPCDACDGESTAWPCGGGSSTGCSKGSQSLRGQFGARDGPCRGCWSWFLDSGVLLRLSHRAGAPVEVAEEALVGRLTLGVPSIQDHGFPARGGT